MNQNTEQISQNKLDKIIDIFQAYKAALDSSLSNMINQIKSNPNISEDQITELKSQLIKLPHETQPQPKSSLFSPPGKIKNESIEQETISTTSSPKQKNPTENGLIAFIKTLKTKYGRPYENSEEEYKLIFDYCIKYNETYSGNFSMDSYVKYMNKAIKLKRKVGLFFYKNIYPYFLENIST